MTERKPQHGFDDCVFVNCPFDEQYYPLLRPLLFTIIALGFRPRIANERLDSGEARIYKIVELIKNSRYAIHDLSRIRASQAGEFCRLNMPFELGIDLGARLFGQPPLSQKRTLILEKDRYEFMKAISDLSGADIRHHSDEPKKAVRCVRNWLVTNLNLKGTPSPTVLWYQFTDFTDEFYDQRRREGFSHEDLNMMPIPEYTEFISSWVRARKTFSR